MSTKSERTGICCIGLIAIGILGFVGQKYGAGPSLILGVVIAIFAILIYIGAKKQQQEKEETEAKRRLAILDSRLKEEEFEKKQKLRGLIKYTDKKGNVRWGTPEEVKQWELKDRTIRETIIEKEILKIKCRYCGTLFDARLDKCPHCGAAQ